MKAIASSPRTRSDQLTTKSASRASGSNLHLGERVSILRERLEARTDERASKQLHNDVREARAYIRDWSPERAVSPDTAIRYTKAIEHMSSAGERPENASCRNSFEFRRAALIHEARKEIKGALRELDSARRTGGVDRAAVAYNSIRSGLEVLRQYPPSTGSRELDLERRLFDDASPH